MCNHFDPPTVARLKSLDLVPDQLPLNYPASTYPGYLAPFAVLGEAGLEVFVGEFGLTPSWAKAKGWASTFNARSETAAQKPSFRDAWRRDQVALVPATAIYEPDWRSGKNVTTRIFRRDGELLWIAGLWSSWQDELSFTLLTLDASTHELFRNFHRPEKDKRMVAMFELTQGVEWLQLPQAERLDGLQAMPATALVAEPVGVQQQTLF